MPSPLKWILELIDKVSAPADKMSKHVHETHESFLEAAVGAKEFERALDGLAEKFTLFELAKGAAELAEKLIDVGVEMGKDALKAADFERTSGLVLATLSGSTEESEKLLERVKHFANEAGISIADSMDLFRDQLAAGAKDVGSNFEIIAQAATDIGHLTGRSARSVEQAFSDIQSRGELTGRSLNAFVGALPFDKLAKKLGVVSGSWEELTKKLSESPVKAGKGIQAILNALADEEGGKIGKLSVDIGKGFEGSFQKIKNSWDELLGKFGETQAFQDIIHIMDRLAHSLEPGQEGGKKLALVVERIAKTTEDFLKPLLEPGGLDRAIEKFSTLANNLATIVNLLAKLSGAALSAPGWIAKQYSSEGWLFSGLGKAAASGVESAEELFHSAGQRLAQANVRGFASRDGIDSHSPSKVFERLGGYAAEGFNQGYEKDKDDAIGVPSATPSPATGDSSHSHRLELNQTFTINAGPGVGLEELAQRIVHLSATSLQGPLETLSISLGGM